MSRCPGPRRRPPLAMMLDGFRGAVSVLLAERIAAVSLAPVAVAIILVRHRGNIARIVAGTERRVGGV
ncbi:MAG TPA: hypothetical protein VFD21_15515 [Vicinamibacterales bacterium]|nr:hypothetical protein [Vicinamibacterales bacterium]